MTNCSLMSDDYSIETKVISNLSSRGNLVHRWAPALLMFVVGSILISRDSSHNSINTSAILRSFNERRELYTPYDKTTNMKLPAWTNSISDIWEPLQKQETPFFWDIPNAGGSTLTKVFSHCLGLTLATNQGVESDNTTLGVYEHYVGANQYPFSARYVNVKTNTEQSIHKCHDRGLLESGLTDMFISQHMVYAAQHLFTTQRRARALVMMRHPVKRVIDQFLSQQQFGTQAMSLAEYVISDQLMENFEVRMLNGITDVTTPITDEHVNIAKEILRRKFVVGIFEWFDVGMVRFEKFFGWWERFDVLNNLTINECHSAIIESGDEVENFPKIDGAEEVYSNILTRSWADVELYHYAKFLFAEQAKLI